MLSLATRDRYSTLLDAAVLAEADERPAIIYVATGREPQRITRRAFREAVAATADSLAALGARPRDLVVIAHTQSLDSIYASGARCVLALSPPCSPRSPRSSILKST
jgi:acyl-coenzyme A synthetase/AMP-(fatty) acid ligase